MPNRYYTSHSEIQGYGDPAMESASATIVQPGEKKQAEVGGVFKDGLIVSGHIAQELSKNPASELFYFQSIQGTDQYYMKPKYPEEIADLDGTRIECRKNMNYFYKALGRSIIGDDGRVDLKNGSEQMGQLTVAFRNRGEKTYQDALYQFIAANGDVAEQDKKSLEQFCHSSRITGADSMRSGILCYNMTASFVDHMTNALVSMDRAAKLKEKRENEGRLSQADQKKLKEYETEAEHRLGEFRFWAGLDPESHQDMIINPDPQYGRVVLDGVLDGLNLLHPDQKINYHGVESGIRKELEKYCVDLEQFYEENSDVWEDLMIKNGILTNEFKDQKAEYEDMEKRQASLMAQMREIQKSDIAMYEELNKAIENLPLEDEELLKAYDKSRNAVRRKIEADRNENPKLIPLNEQYKQLALNMGDLTEKHPVQPFRRKKLFREFCNACMNGDIALDETDPNQKKLTEKLKVLNERGINPAGEYKDDVIAVPKNQPDDSKVYSPTGPFGGGIQVDVTIDGQKWNLAMEAPFYRYDPDKTKGFSRTAIGILKDDEEYRKYTISGKLTKGMEAGWFRERRMSDAQREEAYDRLERYHLPNHLGIRELKSMSGEQLLARLTGVSEASPDRFDSYVQGLKGCMINGQSAIHFLGMEDYAGGAKVNGDRKKEAYIAGMGDVIRERLLDQLKEREPGERQDRFTVTMAGKDGSCQPLKLHFEEEVRPPQREVTKPGALWRAFHSKASIERRMNEYRAYQKQREAYEEYQRQKAAVNEYNKSSELSAGDAEFFRKREELEHSVKAPGKKPEKKKEKDLSYFSYNEILEKGKENKVPASRKRSKSVDMNLEQSAERNRK